MAECSSTVFITLRGPSPAASRTVIGNWIKAVLREAGISASAGSVRWAVTSLNWYENFPIEDILSKGKWRKDNSFARFYCKQIIGRSQCQNKLALNFEPI